MFRCSIINVDCDLSFVCAVSMGCSFDSCQVWRLGVRGFVYMVCGESLIGPAFE